MELNSAYRQQLKGIGHKLKAIITVTDNGLSENIEKEIERALEDHELIKIRISIADRKQRRELADRISTQHSAQVVQRIGNIVLLFRPAKKPKPKLSNLLRAL
ncbi:MAG: YhbY family RNA-binding protein [Pseudomonadales bacterium]